MWDRWSLNKQQKQLAILLLAAAWITIALFLSLEESGINRLGFRAERFIVQGIVWSSPAILFGAIFLWWLRKN
jgi:hypothetical protein